MRRVEISSWCDYCWHADEQTAATHTYSLGIRTGEGAVAVKLVEVCDEHDGYLAQLVELYNELPEGQIAEARSKASTAGGMLNPPPPAAVAEEQDCPVCGKTLSRGGITNHVWTHRPDTRPAAPTRCPECNQQFSNPAGVGVHRRMVHGWDVLVEALSGVPGWDARKAATALYGKAS